MKVIKYQLLLAVALLVGVAIGFFAGDSSKTASQPEPTKSAAKGMVADKGEEATIAALRHQIAELKKKLAEKGEASEEAISNAVAKAVEARPQDAGRPRGNPREWMEDLKKNDPERYTQMTNQFARWRARRAEQAQRKVDFLSSIDTSRMSAGAKKTHNELQALIAKREELEEQMHQEGLDEDERRQIFGQIMETEHAMRKLNQQERTNLIEETAKNLGFQGQEVKDISATIQDVIEATGGNGRGGFGPPPGGGPGGGPGGPGGPGGR